MAENVSDEAFARAVQQAGVVSYDQLETAKAAQAESAAKGVLVSLADMLVQQGVMAAATRENIEKKVRAQQQGGIQQFGQFKLLKKLGEGGMGAVYLAEDTNAGRQVAIKILPKKHADDAGFVSRFRREARAAGQLNHVNIAGAHSVGEEMGYHYLVMEYVEGEPLDKTLKGGGALKWDMPPHSSQSRHESGCRPPWNRCASLLLARRWTRLSRYCSLQSSGHNLRPWIPKSVSHGRPSASK